MKFDLGQIKRSTWDVKENYIKLYILPYFGDARACEIKVKDVERWLQMISVWSVRKGTDKTSHPTSKTKRSSATVNTACQMLGQIFKFGIKNFGLTSDPTSLAERMRCTPMTNASKYGRWNSLTLSAKVSQKNTIVYCLS